MSGSKLYSVVSRPYALEPLAVCSVKSAPEKHQAPDVTVGRQGKKTAEAANALLTQPLPVEGSHTLPATHPLELQLKLCTLR